MTKTDAWTGRDLLLYILENKLEDKPIFENGRPAGFLTIEEAAASIGAGVATIHAMIQIKKIQYLQIGNQYFIPKDSFIFKRKEI